MIIGISGKKQSGKNTVALIWQYLYDYYYNNYKHPMTVEDFKEYVKNNHHLKSAWKQKSFAYKIKQITCTLLGCTMEQLEDPIFKETPLGEEWWCWRINEHKMIPYIGNEKYYSDPYLIEESLVKLTPRILMQMLGTEFGRDMVHPNLWVNSLFSDYNPIDNRTFQDPDDSNIDYPLWLITDVRFINEAEAIKDRQGIIIRVNRDNDSKDDHASENDLDDYKDFDYIIDNNGSIEDLILKIKEIIIKENVICH